MKSGCGRWGISRERVFFIIAMLLLYAALYYAMDRLCFEIRKDELHFWPTSVRFSERLIPSLDLLRSYTELSTPLPFLAFGLLEHLFHAGIWAGRLLNLLLSLVVVCIVGMPHSRSFLRPIAAALGLFLFPYYVGVSVHLYTDIIATFFILLAVDRYLAGKHWISALCSVCAIASRQYMVAFPASIALYELSRRRPPGMTPRAEWVAPLAASLSLIGWIIVFGGLAPPAAVQGQTLTSAAALRLFPAHALYFLSTVGAYFVLLEAVLFPLDARLAFRVSKRYGVIGVVLAGLFLIFPPLQNVSYSIPTMGLLDKAARTVLSDPPRMVLFYLLALAACFRFARHGLGAAFVYCNAAVMLKAVVGWDKYALPLVAVLWYLKARGILEPSGSGSLQAPGVPFSGRGDNLGTPC